MFSFGSFFCVLLMSIRTGMAVLVLYVICFLLFVFWLSGSLD